MLIVFLLGTHTGCSFSKACRLAEQGHQDACGDGGTDNTSNVRAHGVHEQEVGGVLLLADDLGDTRGHRNGGNTGGTDQRVDLLLQEEVHELGKQDAASSTEAEGNDTHRHDLEGLDGEEGGRRGGSADGEAEEDGDDVHQLVTGSLLQTVNNARLLEEVTEHQARDQRSGGRNEQRHEHGDHDGEDDLLALADLTQRAHHDLTLFLGGQNLHDGGLDDRNERHVRVSGNGDGAEQLGSETGGDEDRGRAVSAADDTDGGGLLIGEAHELGADIGHEDTELGGSAEQQGLGVRDQGAEVGHRTDAHEDQAGVDAQLNAEVEDVQKTEADRAADSPGCKHRLSNAGLCHFCQEFLRDGRSSEEIPMDMSAGEEDLVEHLRAGEVGAQHTEGDGQQQQRLKALYDGQIQQHEGNADHDEALPVAVLTKHIEAGLLQEIDNSRHLCFFSFHS